MNPYRTFRLVAAIALAAIGLAGLAVGDLVTAVLALAAAGLGVVFAVGTTSADARAGRSWRTAEPWGRNAADATLVVFHTAVLMYLDERGRARFAEQVRRLPGHWLSVEARMVTPGIRVRDDVENDSSDLVLALDGVQLAWAQPHGRAIRWMPNP